MTKTWFDLHPKAKVHEQFRDGMEYYGPPLRPCHVCGKMTGWVEINYGAFFCSPGCLDEYDNSFNESMRSGWEEQR